MAAYVIQLINLFLLFRFVLGCEFRKNRGLVIFGFILSAVWLGLQCIDDGMYPANVYLGVLMYISIPAVVFRGRLGFALGISAVFYEVQGIVYNLVLGIGIIIKDGMVTELNYYSCTVLSLLFVTLGLSVTGLGVKSHYRQIWIFLQRLNPLLFIPVFMIMYILRLESGYSGEIEENTVRIISAIHMSKNGVIGIFTLTILVLLCINSNQKRELRQEVSFNKKCITRQAEQYRLIGERDMELRKFRHDFNKHISVLQKLSQEGRLEEVNGYINSLGMISEGFSFLSTNNLVCDAIVNQYNGLCKKAGIDFFVSGKIDGMLQVPQADLCVILSNAFENAFDAVRKYGGDGKREISLKIRREKHFLFFEMRNPVSTPISIKDGCPVSRNPDHRNHGIGTRNMKEAAEKNGGFVFWINERTDSVLTKLILPCEIKEKS